MLKMQVLGEQQKVATFMEGFKSLPQYQILTETKSYNQVLDTEVAFALFEVNQSKTHSMMLQITTMNNKELVLNLDQAQMRKAENGITWIKGKVHDIYW
ncbi:hypothetical protein [Thermoflavimicrobium daqui]|jgi:hypothetical protein|uniref:Uncharacterized protein n=1 Tax=Thermoflavimicrobium daqui TaxID=2137476 RepID=A0A364K559_9BACL|nr:hypothetical protein [Thermoflavimicrobium daqui]RAL24467.1 hypothetical protein DL897_09110 [Thermoflavimicrobium daqui]